MLVHLHYFHNDRRYNIPEFTVIMNYTVRDDQPIIMYIPDPENKMIKSKNYCLDYFWKPISVEFEVPSDMMDVDFEHRAIFSSNELDSILNAKYEQGKRLEKHDLSLYA